MHKCQYRDIRNIEKQGNMTLSKEHNNSLVIEKEIYEIPEREFKMTVLRRFSDIQEYRELIQQNLDLNKKLWPQWKIQQRDSYKTESNRNIEILEQKIQWVK